MYIFQATPPEILVDFNMTDERGTVPALARHIRGLRPDDLYVGQRMTAMDADDNSADAVILSVDGERLRLFLMPSAANQIDVDPIEIPTGEIETEPDAPGLIVRVNGNPDPIVVA